MYLVGMSVAVVSAMGYYDTPHVKLEPMSVPDVSLPQPPMDCVPEDQQQARNIEYCPEVSKLVLRNNAWYAPGKDWKTYQFSFTKSLSRFVGAQWIGTNVGRTVCLYEGDNANDFPVQISLNKVVLAPELPVWNVQKDKTYACVSQNNQICDCPIQPFKEQQSPINAKAAIDQLTRDN